MFIFILGALLSSIFDIKKMIIPNKIVYPAFLLGLFESYIIEQYYSTLLFSFIHGLLFIFLASNKLIGYGDAKLAFLLGGIQINIVILIICIFFELFFSGIVALFFVKKAEKFPIGPIMTAITLFFRFIV